ncbi:unnamed protein product [Acidithrix sp. C25]|nr:unnamed protein product [Acidithrix sp. C25]
MTTFESILAEFPTLVIKRRTTALTLAIYLATLSILLAATFKWSDRKPQKRL